MEQNPAPTPEVSAEPDEDRGDRIARRVLLANLGIATACALTVAGFGLTGRSAAAYQVAPTPVHNHPATTTESPTAKIRTR